MVKEVRAATNRRRCEKLEADQHLLSSSDMLYAWSRAVLQFFNTICSSTQQFWGLLN